MRSWGMRMSIVGLGLRGKVTVAYILYPHAGADSRSAPLALVHLGEGALARPLEGGRPCPGAGVVTDRQRVALDLPDAARGPPLDPAALHPLQVERVGPVAGVDGHGVLE